MPSSSVPVRLVLFAGALVFSLGTIVGQAEAERADSTGREQPEARSLQLASVFGVDKRIVMPKTKPYSAVGRLTTSEGYVCTAFLINACTVVTAAHCLRKRGKLSDPKSDDGAAFKNPRIQFSTGLSYALQNVVAGDPNNGLSQEMAFAQVAPDRDGVYPGQRLGRFPVEDESAENMRVSPTYCLPGFSSDIPGNTHGQISYTDEHVVLIGSMREKTGKGPREGLLHMGATGGGASGAPIFRCPKLADGSTDFSNPAVVAIHVSSEGEKYPKRDTVPFEMMSKGLATRGFFRKLESYVASNRCRDATTKQPNLKSIP